MKKEKSSFVFVIPPSSQILSSRRKFLQKSPLGGVSYIATTLRHTGYNVEIVDFRNEETSLDEILNKDEAIIGITTFADSFCFLEDFINKVRIRNKDIPVILGGPFVTSATEILLKNLSVDYAVLGEGELTILELMNALSKGKENLIPSIPGICYKKDGKNFFTKPRPQIVNLDNLPLLDFTLWPVVKDRHFLEKIGLSSTRGCCGKCALRFKTIPLIREMSPSRFGMQISFLVKKYGLKFVFLNDLTFVTNKKRTIELCNALNKSGVRWSCNIRLCSTAVDILDDELFQLMKENGCQEIWYGIESVNQKVLDANFEGVNINELDKTIKMTNKAGIKAVVNVIVGLPGETEESLNELVSFVETREIIPCNIKYFMPLPGTSIYHYTRQNGLIKDEIEYLRMLSLRKGNFFKDKIINSTDLPEEKLRETFMKLSQVSYKRCVEEE